jgi:YidC/Oxa1 family membrane protein insertase
MAILVGSTMWVQQRMMTPTSASADPQQQQMTNTMLWMMPLMFGYFTLNFPSGLALYWVATNVVSIVLQYFYIGPSNVSWRRIFSFGSATAPAARSADQKPAATQEGAEEDEVVSEEAGVEDHVRRRRRRRRRGRHRRR